MENTQHLAEPLRITESGKYELSDYKAFPEIAISGALFLNDCITSDLSATVKIMEKETHREFDRFMMSAFHNPMEPALKRIAITGKFFNPKKHYLSIQTNSASEPIHFMLNFSKR